MYRLVSDYSTKVNLKSQPSTNRERFAYLRFLLKTRLPRRLSDTPDAKSGGFRDIGAELWPKLCNIVREKHCLVAGAG